MPLKSLMGVDHVVIAVRDLDRAARGWAALGFTIAPRGIHSPALGTANHTIMLGEDYLELIGVLTPTEQNIATRELLREREGIERTAFTARDAVAGAQEVCAMGLAPLGPIHFGRPVERPDGGTSDARFSVFRWPMDQRPGGMAIFACQHHTREAVWLPELLRHANGATRIVRIEIVDEQPEAAAQQLCRLIAQPIQPIADATFAVPSGDGRADFLFMDADHLRNRYPEQAHATLPKSGAVALVLATASLADAARAVGMAGISHGDSVVVAPTAANGVILSFISES